MKKTDKKRFNISIYNELIAFYNSPAEDFYKSNIVIYSNQFDTANKLKSDLLYFLVEFERVIKATFHSSLGLEEIDLDLFKKMFPNICEEIFKIKNSQDLIDLGRVLKSFRNLNAHALPSYFDYQVFKFDFSALSKQKTFISDIEYLTFDNKLTMAGFIFIIANLGRAQSIKSLTTKDHNIGLITCGNIDVDSGNTFVGSVSRVDWEIKIREDNKKTISEAVFGNLLPKALTDTDYSFKLLIGNEDIFDVNLDVKIDKDYILVYKNSLSSVFYQKPYRLIIKDKKGFIELANQFPPFVFIDLLYKLNISTFSKQIYKNIVEEKHWNLYSKLMYPKFYSDKNIDILLADKSKSDLRVNSSVCNGALHAVFMKLERLIIKNYKIDLHKVNYSRIGDLLSEIGVNKKLAYHIQIIRNLVSHGYILGEHVYTNDDFDDYNLERVIDFLVELVAFFKKNNQEVYRCLSNDISLLFINQMLSMKTKLYIRESITYLENYPESTNLEELKKKSHFFDNSSYTPELFTQLNQIIDGDLRCIKITLKGLDVDLILMNNEKGLVSLDKLIQKSKTKITNDRNDGVFRYITLN